MSIRERLGFHDGVGRAEAALACLAVFLMLPAFAVMALADLIERLSSDQ